jgi:hypothetical protein
MPPKLEASYKKIEKFIKFNLAGNLIHSTSEFIIEKILKYL